MKAMILAAGRGERLKPLTDTVPKPLIQVGGGTLIEHHLERLADAGIEQVVINVSWLAERIEAFLGDGSAYGLEIRYSREPEGPLETAGGIRRALPLLGKEPFLLISGDILTHCRLRPLIESPLAGSAHLVLVDNPDHHRKGDFHLADGGRVEKTGRPRLTYSGIAVVNPKLFEPLPDGIELPLRKILEPEIDAGRVTGTYYPGLWLDVGTPGRLASARFLDAMGAAG